MPASFPAAPQAATFSYYELIIVDLYGMCKLVFIAGRGRNALPELIGLPENRNPIGTADGAKLRPVLAPCRRMCYIKSGKARDTRPTPDNEQLTSYEASRHYWQ